MSDLNAHINFVAFHSLTYSKPCSSKTNQPKAHVVLRCIDEVFFMAKSCAFKFVACAWQRSESCRDN